MIINKWQKNDRGKVTAFFFLVHPEDNEWIRRMQYLSQFSRIITPYTHSL